MKKIIFSGISFMVLGLLFINVAAQDITLPAPQKTGGKPLMEALNERKTTREFTDENLTQQQFSNLLWAAWGINRPDNRRTAPSALNYQEIDLYVALPEGLYLYLADSHSLKMIHNRDIRKFTGSQGFVATAPVNFVYVADMAKARKKEGDVIEDSDLFMSYANTAFIGQNVYLFCASENLGCVVRGSVPNERLAQELQLRPNQRITLAQTIGIPLK
jgi:nitroreductase